MKQLDHAACNALTETSQMIAQLHQSGAISDDEQTLLLEEFWQCIAHQQLRAQLRSERDQRLLLSISTFSTRSKS